MTLAPFYHPIFSTLSYICVSLRSFIPRFLPWYPPTLVPSYLGIFLSLVSLFILSLSSPCLFSFLFHLLSNQLRQQLALFFCSTFTLSRSYQDDDDDDCCRLKWLYYLRRCRCRRLLFKSCSSLKNSRCICPFSCFLSWCCATTTNVPFSHWNCCLSTSR